MKKIREKNTSSYDKKCLVAFAVTMLAVLLGAAGLVIYVDPFFHYHAPLKDFPYLVDNQLNQNPGMASHMEYDSVMLGSSMTVNFNMDWFEELLDLHTMKLSYSGAFPKDQANIMGKIFDSDNTIKKVFLGVDVITYMGDVEETKYPLPEYLYDDNVINDVSYLWNKDVLLNYILRPIADPDKTDLATVYASWWTDDYYNIKWVMHNYVSPDKVEQETPADAYIAGVEANLTENICPYIEANPDTEFVIFFPPYSILFWNDVLQENHLEATMAEYKYLTNRLMEYENVSVYFFPDREDIILDLNNYADYSHYHPQYNRFMTECFADGSCRVITEEEKTADDRGETIDEYLTHMRQIVADYDFEELFSKDY